MLDHRVYRAAFLPALVAAFVLAFSLEDIPRGETTAQATLAFDAQRAFTTMRDLAERFPQRRPGSQGDLALADRVAERLDASGFAEVRRFSTTATTIDGKADLETVMASREGISGHRLLVVAHRDAAGEGAQAELSGTAVLLELARLFADRELKKTVTLASVSGGSGGFAGARAAARELEGPVDAVLVLGDLASGDERKPLVVPWANGGAPAPESLARTVASAVREESGLDPGRTGMLAQFVRRAVPLTRSEQGEINREGLPAVLLSASSERPPPASAPVDRPRFEAFGRATLRAIYASLEARGDRPFEPSDGIVGLNRLLPTWAVRLFVLTLLLPVLATALDGLFRARRRNVAMGHWLAWAALWAAPALAAWAWARGMGATGAVTALPAPAPGPEPPLDGMGWTAMVTAVLVAAAVGFIVARRAPRGPRLVTGAAAAAVGVLLSVLVLGVWIFNPYAAALLLPAAHAWLLATASRQGPRRVVGAIALLAGVVAPLGVIAYYLHAWQLDPIDGLWSAFNLAAGGALGPGAAIAVAGFTGALIAVATILRARRGLADSEPAADDTVVTRGPRTYAGPGSLGGTESALRR